MWFQYLTFNPGPKNVRSPLTLFSFTKCAATSTLKLVQKMLLGVKAVQHLVVKRSDWGVWEFGLQAC
jgi:hypothetical protein